MPIYRAYGLAIRSDINLPALPQIDAASIDIDICAADIPLDAGGMTKFRNWEAGPGRYLGRFFDVGKVLVTDGSIIQYDRQADADDTQIVSVLMGTGLAAALMQRKILPIHSCSVLTDQGAVLVMGRSGAGKSTMLGGLQALGLPMLADDVTGLVENLDGEPIAIPGFPAIRLWKDSLNKLGHSSSGLPQVRSDINKYYLPSADFHPEPAPIRAIVHLTASNEEAVRIDEVAPAHRVEALSRFIFRKNFIDGLGLRRFAFGQVARAVDQVTMLRVTRSAKPVEPSTLAAQMLEAIAQTERASAQ